MKATRGQLARIHIARKELGLDEATYRDALRAATGKDSAGRMDYGEASRAIAWFVAKGWQPANRSAFGETPRGKNDERRTPNSERFNELRGRPGMATPGELRKIEAMWADIARGNPQTTLRAFLFRRWQVSDLRFLTARQAWEVIEAVKAIRARRYPRGEIPAGTEARPTGR